MNRKTFLSQSANAGESTSAAFKLLDSSDIQAVQEFVENLRDFGESVSNCFVELKLDMCSMEWRLWLKSERALIYLIL